MSAYVLSEVEFVDESAAAAYRELAARSIAAYGGRYLARGAAPEVAEGAPSAARMVLVEFPSMERVREWHRSPEYAQALRWRDAGLKRRLMFFGGVPPG